jgi:hypothetical protein
MDFVQAVGDVIRLTQAKVRLTSVYLLKVTKETKPLAKHVKVDLSAQVDSVYLMIKVASALNLVPKTPVVPTKLNV